MDSRQNYYIEFPTPQLLRAANVQHTKGSHTPPRSESGQPLPEPCARNRKAVFDPTKYEDVDNFALGVNPDNYDQPLKAFTECLVAPFSNDQMAVVRLIFRWLAAQDMRKLDEDHDTGVDTVQFFLSKLKASSGYYAEIFLQMCRYAGIQGELIHGFAKHAHLELGERPGSKDVNTWVAVAINDEWRLVDPHWGSCHMVDASPGEWLLIDDAGQGAKRTKDSEEGTEYACNDTYFLTDPEQLIYSHIPKDEERLQLLARPVTLREFTEMAYLKPAFFELGLTLLQHRTSILHASNGEIDIQIGTPPRKRRKFMYRLWMSNQMQVDDVTLDRFCIMRQANSLMSCRIYFPKTGKFKLELFGSDGDSKTGDKSLKIVCAFVIYSDTAAEGVKAFPENTRSEWGPGADLEDAGLTPVFHTGPMIEAEGGNVDVRFQAKPGTKILHNMHSNTMNKESLKGYTIHYMDPDRKEIVVCTSLPENGDYALNIFAPIAKQSENFQNVCNYIVSTSNAPIDPIPYPAVTNGEVGSHDGNRAVNLKLTSHATPLIVCPDSGHITLVFDGPIPCETTTTLKHHTAMGTTEKDDLVWTSHDDKTVSFDVHIPESGVYTMCIFAKELDADGSYTHVYTCILSAPVPMESCHPFPTSYSQWKPGCQIIEPMTSKLKANSKVKFIMKIPHAHSVSTVDNNNKWTPLHQEDDLLWYGDVDTGGLGEMKLSLEIDKGSGTFSTLLKYKVEEENELIVEDEKQKQVMCEAKAQQEALQQQQQNVAESREEHFQKSKEELLEATEVHDLTALRRTIKTIEQEKYVSRLDSEVEEARKLAESLTKIQKLTDDFDNKNMSVVVQQPTPPKGVHDVVRATLLLLGHSQAETEDWPECTKLLEALDLAKCMRNFSMKTLRPQTTHCAADLIGDLRLDDVTDTVAEVGPLYEWATCVIHESRYIEPIQAESQQTLISPESITSVSQSPEEATKADEDRVLIMGFDRDDAWNILYFICFLLFLMLFLYLMYREA